jgi:hypothetical protein
MPDKVATTAVLTSRRRKAKFIESKTGAPAAARCSAA